MCVLLTVEVYMQLKDFGADIEKLKKQLETDPNNIELLLKLSELYLKVESGDYYNSVILLDKILELEPANFPANRIRGLIYREQDNTEKALECFKTILDHYSYASEHPEYADIRFDYAELLEEVDKEEEALEIFEELRQKSPKNVAILFKLAHLYEVMEKHEGSIATYKYILELDPENEAALTQLVKLYESVDKKLYHLNRAELAIKEGNLNRAISEYKKMIPYAVEPADECDCHKKIAQIYLLQENYNQALDEYNLALDIVEGDYEIYKGLGKVYYEMEEYEGAIECFEKALTLSDNKDYSIYMDLADSYIELEKYPEALRELETVKKHIPDNMDIRCSIAEGYINTRNYYKAKEELDYILAREPNNTRALGVLVDLNLEKEDFQSALEVAKKLVEVIPNSAYSSRKMAECYEALNDPYNAHYNFGLAYELQSECGMAIDEYEHALDIEPQNAELIMKIGDLYITMGEKFIGIEYFERAAEVDEGNLLPLKRLSEFYLANNELDKAQDVLARLVEIDNRNSDALYDLAVIYEKQKYLEDALECYNRFLELAPNSAKADQVSSKMVSIKKKLHIDVGDSVDNADEYEDDRTVFQKILGFFKG